MAPGVDDKTDEALILSMNPADVAKACRAVAPSAISVVDRVLESALQGSRDDVVAYVCAFDEVLVATSRALAKSGSLASPFAVDVVADQAAAAPFDVWADEYGLGVGVALYAVEQLRPGGFEHPRGHASRRSRETYLRFRKSVAQARRQKTPDALSTELLESVAGRFQLSHTDFGKLFGVSRQAIKKWIDEGQVPAERQPKVATIYAIAELLTRHLKVAALPGVVRTAADDYGGLTLLQMVAADRHEEVLAGARQAFDYSTAA